MREITNLIEDDENYCLHCNHHSAEGSSSVQGGHPMKKFIMMTLMNTISIITLTQVQYNNQSNMPGKNLLVKQYSETFRNEICYRFNS